MIGKPDMTVVAFGSDVVDIFEVNDIMSSKGWHLNALQRPNRYTLLPDEQFCFRTITYCCYLPYAILDYSDSHFLFSLHICVTLQHTAVYEEFLKDLQDSMNTVSCCSYYLGYWILH